MTIDGETGPGGALDARSIELRGKILDVLGHGPFIFNLGHGVIPETPIEHIERVVRRVVQGPGGS